MKKIFFSTSIILVVISLFYILFWNLENKKVKATLKDTHKFTYIDYSNKKFAQNVKKYSFNKTNNIEKQINFKKLNSTYKDAVAWININNTNIDFPLVQKNNNKFYLNHNIDGSYNSAGWPFIDYRNSLDILSTNTTIYGHNRLDNSMFGTLSNCLKESWYKNKDNQHIIFSTKNETYIFKIFSIYEVPAESYFSTPYFESIEEHQNFLDTIVKRSIFNFNEPINISDKILTVSTCSNNLKDRIIVHGKLIESFVTE